MRCSRESSSELAPQVAYCCLQLFAAPSGTARVTSRKTRRGLRGWRILRTFRSLALHPGIAEHYRRVVGDLAQALHRSDSEAAAEARDLVRRLIEMVVVTPLPERGQYALTVKGQIASLVNQDGDCTTVVGAGAGFGRYLTPAIRFLA